MTHKLWVIEHESRSMSKTCEWDNVFYLLVVSGEFYGAQVLTGMISSALSYQMPSWF